MKYIKSLFIILFCVLLSSCSSDKIQKNTSLKIDKSPISQSSNDMNTNDNLTEEDLSTDKVEEHSSVDKFTSYITNRFESSEENNDEHIRLSLNDQFNEIMLNKELSEDDLTSRYFMSKDYVNDLKLRLMTGYVFDNESLIVHNTKTDGVVEWIIKLKLNNEEKIVSGFRNQIGSLPLTYVE